MSKPAKRRVRVAISQFPVTLDVRANGRWIRRLIRSAADQGADILQTPEAALCGYDHQPRDWRAFDWAALVEETTAIRAEAAAHGLWLTLGSAHWLGARSLPTNCLYLIDGRGEVVDRYDKRFLTPPEVPSFSAGGHAVTWTFKGFRFGMLVCYDGCFPHLYRANEELGVEVMLHSFYNAGFDGPTCLDTMVPALVQVRATDHDMWIAASNSCGRHSSWPSLVACTDGTVALRMSVHRAGVAVHEITGMDPPPGGWRHMGENRPLYRRGVLGNGVASTCARACDRSSPPVVPGRRA